MDITIIFIIFAACYIKNKSMNKDIKHSKSKKFRMPYGDIAIWSFLMMPFSFFVLDSPIVFWLSFLLFVLAISCWSGRWINESKGCPLPWWYGGL